MQDDKDWQKLSAPLYAKSRLDNKHGWLSQYDIGPYQKVDPASQQTHPMFTDPELFYNICSPHADVMDPQFIEAPQAAFMLKDQWPEALSRRHLFVYCQASSNLTPFKKAMLQEGELSKLNLGLDPFGLGLWESRLYPTDQSPELFQVSSVEQHLFRIHSQAYAMAGADEIQQLAILLASLQQLIVDYRGLASAEDIINTTSFEMALKPHLMLSVAQLRAFALLWLRFKELYEIETGVGELNLFACPSVRYMSRREPWNNILRLSVQVTAARLGGAQGFQSLPYDFLSGPECKGFRTSRNIPEVLEMESHLGRVSHSLNGSVTLQELVDSMAQKAWDLFVEIEKKEGLKAVLRSGWIQQQIHEKAQSEQNSFLAGQLILTGCNDYPLLQSLDNKHPLVDEKTSISLETWWSHEFCSPDSEPLCDVQRLVPQALTDLFEKWQFMGDRWPDKDLFHVWLLVDESLQGSLKLKNIQRVLERGGLRWAINPDKQKTPVAMVIAADPESDFVKKSLHDLIDRNCDLKVWGGEKKPPGFDFAFQSSDHFQSSYEKMHSCFARFL
jgi:hypothetical protein